MYLDWLLGFKTRYGAGLGASLQILDLSLELRLHGLAYRLLLHVLLVLAIDLHLKMSYHLIGLTNLYLQVSFLCLLETQPLHNLRVLILILPELLFKRTLG